MTRSGLKTGRLCSSKAQRLHHRRFGAARINLAVVNAGDAPSIRSVVIVVKKNRIIGIEGKMIEIDGKRNKLNL